MTGNNPGPKNIVLCFDGTGDWATVDKTNVTKIYERLDRTTQSVFYSGGVGTLGSPMALSGARRLLLKLLDLAVATSLRDQVLAGYLFLVREYNPGDRIYMFGFSRGAFTARVLAALIHNFGLLEDHSCHLAPYLWQTINDFSSFAKFKKDSATIKNLFSQKDKVEIEFMGLFDTVSSVGIFERFKVFPYTDKNPSVKHSRHAVSIDEERNAFPELLLRPDKNDVVEIWFPGVHRDVGGGDESHPGLPNTTLNWIVEQAHIAGLTIDTTRADTTNRTRPVPRFDPYVVAGLYPMKMFDYRLDLAKLRKPTDPGFRNFWPNFKHKRQIPENANVYDETNGSVNCGGVNLPIEKAENPGPPSYPARCFHFRDLSPVSPQSILPDAIGIVLGVALSFLIANRGMDNPLSLLDANWTAGWWKAWPGNTSIAAFFLFFAFIVQQGLSQKFARLFPFLNWVTPFLGVALCTWLAISVLPWQMLGIGAALGLFAAGISLLGGKPILRADRAVPFFFVPWFMIILGLWIVPPVWRLAWPAINFTGSWVGAPTTPATLEPWLDYVAWTLAVVSLLIGIRGIVADRRKLATEPSTNTS